MTADKIMKVWYKENKLFLAALNIFFTTTEVCS